MDEVDFLPLTGSELYDVVQRGKPTAGSTDGWAGVNSKCPLVLGLAGLL